MDLSTLKRPSQGRRSTDQGRRSTDQGRRSTDPTSPSIDEHDESKVDPMLEGLDHTIVAMDDLNSPHSRGSRTRELGEPVDVDEVTKEQFLKEIEIELKEQLTEQEKPMKQWWEKLKTEHDVLSVFFASGFDSKVASKRGISILSKVYPIQISRPMN